jgi:hypothetical protein
MAIAAGREDAWVAACVLTGLATALFIRTAFEAGTAMHTLSGAIPGDHP